MPHQIPTILKPKAVSQICCLCAEPHGLKPEKNQGRDLIRQPCDLCGNFRYSSKPVEEYWPEAAT